MVGSFTRFGVVVPPAVQRLELQHTPMLVICSPIHANHDLFNHAQPALRLHVSLVSIQLVGKVRAANMSYSSFVLLWATYHIHNASADATFC